MLASILLFLLVLSVIVISHELGHFWMAKRAGILVEEFGFGLPPKVWSKKIGETVYSINLLPIGGFVRLHGETLETTDKSERAFLSKSKKVRAAIVSAGVVMNFLLALLAFSIVYSFSGITRDTGIVKVVEVAQDSPAEQIGLRNDDVILGIGGVSLSSTEEFVAEVEKNRGNEIEISVKRSDATLNYKVTPRQDPPEGQGALGVVISSSEIYNPPWWQRPFYGGYYGIKEAVFWGVTVIAGFATMIGGLLRGSLPQDVAGPVGIYAVTTEAARFGALSLINFIGVLSVNLAILNILPFPALDGGRLLFIIIESVLGKKVLPKAEAITHTIGLVILILLIVAITASDIQKLISLGGISGYIESVVK